MHVTIVLCTWNRAPLLSQALDAITKLQEPQDATWDIVVVDNASTDATQDVLRSFVPRLPLTIEFEREPGLSNARNRGLDAARGEYVLWTDDDVLVDTDWLCQFIAGVRRHPDAAIFGGTIRPWFPSPPDPDLLIEDPRVIRHILGHLGVPTDVPAARPARSPPLPRLPPDGEEAAVPPSPLAPTRTSPGRRYDPDIDVP